MSHYDSPNNIYNHSQEYRELDQTQEKLEACRMPELKGDSISREAGGGRWTPAESLACELLSAIFSVIADLYDEAQRCHRGSNPLARLSGEPVLLDHRLVPSPYDSPDTTFFTMMTLTHVCSRWRRVARMDTSLWRHVYFDRRVPRLALLEWLMLSGKQMLDITIDFPSFHDAGTRPPNAPHNRIHIAPVSHDQLFLDLIPHIARCRSLSVNVDCTYELMGFLESFGDGGSVLPIERLRISADCRSCYNIIPDSSQARFLARKMFIDKATPKLREVCLYNIPVSWCHEQFYHALHTLDISRSPYDDETHKILTVLRTSNHVKSLSIGPQFISQPGLLGQILMKTVLRLDVYFEDTDNARRFFTTVMMPNLEILFICLLFPKSDTVLEHLTRPMPALGGQTPLHTVSTLIVDYIDARPPAVKAFLTALTNISQIVFTGFFGVSIIRAILDDAEEKVLEACAAKRDPPLCPLLQEIITGEKYHYVVHPSSNLILKAMNARDAITYPFQHVVLGKRMGV